MKDKEIWYRFEDQMRAGSADEFGDFGPSTVHVYIFEYEVSHHTPKGVQLIVDSWSGVKRFVLKSSVKRFACPTIEEALESFLARKKKQAYIYATKISQIEEAEVIAQREARHALKQGWPYDKEALI